MNISEDDFYDLYLPVELEDGSCLLTEDLMNEIMSAHVENRSWTLVVGDEGLCIVPGILRVNAIGYYITEKSYDNTDLIVKLD